MTSTPTPSPIIRQITRLALFITPITLILWFGYELYDTSPNNLKVLARVDVNPDIRLDLIAMSKVGDAPLKLNTSFSFIEKNIPKFITDLKYPWVQKGLKKFHNRHESRDYTGTLTSNTLTCYFLLWCRGHNNISGYVPVRDADTAMRKLSEAGGGYLLSDSYSFYQGIQGIDLEAENHFAPHEIDSVDLPWPFPTSNSMTATLTTKHAPQMKIEVGLENFWPANDPRYGDKTYLQFSIPQALRYTDDNFDPVSTRSDGTSTSLESYCFERGGGTSYYDIYRLNPSTVQLPALNLNDFTTITVGVPKLVLHPKKFEFILTP